MPSLFRALAERLKALFATHAAMELEAEFLARDAERRVELLQRAERYAAEGWHGIAAQLRQQAEAVSIQRSLAAMLPALDHLVGDRPDDPLAPPLLSIASRNGPSAAAHKSLPAPNKKGKSRD